MKSIVMAFAIVVFAAIIFNVFFTSECGVCGAHLIEWWQVSTMDGSGFCNVCQFCYHDIAY